jgi:hypothetical protein
MLLCVRTYSLHLCCVFVRITGLVQAYTTASAQLVGELAESVLFDHAWMDAAPTLLRDLEDSVDAAMRGGAVDVSEGARGGDDHPTLRVASFLKLRHEQRHGVSSSDAGRRRSENPDEDSDGGLWLPIDKQSQVRVPRVIDFSHTM